MRATSWRIRKVQNQWQIFEPGWAISPMAQTESHTQAIRLLALLQSCNVTTKRPMRGH